MTTTPYVPPVATPPPAAAPQKSSGCLKWSLIGCGIVVVLFAAFCAALVIFVFGAIKHSDVYKGALARVQNDPRVITALGSPIEPGFLVSGNVHVDTNGGNAEINFPVSGPKAKAKVHASATLEDGKWKYETLTATPEGGAPIDLNASP
ncbi:MAG TPA: cytochrome c oxidase assembly factor 1 family protein [Thermoanaerobaculia bacterium]|nr:cytochrome c oxidase assembly factor 1 family protein [Thermoanaerobaculia bacterium]